MIYKETDFFVACRGALAGLLPQSGNFDVNGLDSSWGLKFAFPDSSEYQSFSH